jgi:hypothetical protein
MRHFNKGLGKIRGGLGIDSPRTTGQSAPGKPFPDCKNESVFAQDWTHKHWGNVSWRLAFPARLPLRSPTPSPLRVAECWVAGSPSTPHRPVPSFVAHRQGRSGYWSRDPEVVGRFQADLQTRLDVAQAGTPAPIRLVVFFS